MNRHYKHYPKIWLPIIVCFSAALACHLPFVGGPSPSDPESTFLENLTSGGPGQSETSGDNLTSSDQDDLLAGSSTGAGTSLENPIPVGTTLTTTYWDIQLLEVARGETAWQIIQADNPDSPPPPPGKEYYLAKVKVTCKNPEPRSHDLDLSDLYIIGDSLRGYKDVLWDIPQPEFYYSDIYTAESLEGWIDVLIEPDLGNLMLVFDREEYLNEETQPRLVRFLALEEGASIVLPSEIESIQPNDAGVSKENPAQVGVPVITDHWQVTIQEARRGQAAMDLVLQMNPDNKSPEDGREYIVFRVSAQSVGPGNNPTMIDSSDFKMIVPGMGRGGSDTMEDPFVKIDPLGVTPHLSMNLLPGGKTEGWVVKQVPTGYTPLLIDYLYLDGVDSSDWDRRYILLEP